MCTRFYLHICIFFSRGWWKTIKGCLLSALFLRRIISSWVSGDVSSGSKLEWTAFFEFGRGIHHLMVHKVTLWCYTYWPFNDQLSTSLILPILLAGDARLLGVKTTTWVLVCERSNRALRPDFPQRFLNLSINHCVRSSRWNCGKDQISDHSVCLFLSPYKHKKSRRSIWI